jgi:hypothetical protein
VFRSRRFHTVVDAIEVFAAHVRAEVYRSLSGATGRV